MIENRELEVDLVLLPVSNFDVILEMNWLAAHRARVDCQ